jgi:hypothetical protein
VLQPIYVDLDFLTSRELIASWCYIRWPYGLIEVCNESCIVYENLLVSYTSLYVELCSRHHFYLGILAL